MAKVIITLQDLPDNKVSIVTDPPLEKFLQMEMSGNVITSAQGYAFRILNEIRKESKRNAPTMIDIPKLVRH